MRSQHMAWGLLTNSYAEPQPWGLSLTLGLELRICVCVLLNPNITLFSLPLSCPHTCPIPICFLPVLLLIYYLIKKIQEGHFLYALSAYSMYYLEGDVTSASSLGGPVTCFTGSLINLPSSQ